MRYLYDPSANMPETNDERDERHAHDFEQIQREDAEREKAEVDRFIARDWRNRLGDTGGW